MTKTTRKTRIAKAKQTLEKKKRKADKEKLKSLRSSPSRRREIRGLSDRNFKTNRSGRVRRLQIQESDDEEESNDNDVYERSESSEGESEDEVMRDDEAQKKPSGKSNDRDLDKVIEVLEVEEDPRWKFYEDTREGDDEERRRMNMLNIYNSTKSFPKSETICTELIKIIRRSVIPHVKFWNEGDGKFGSDEKPDFTEKNYWGNKMFEQMKGTKFESDGAKSMAWTSYKEDLKKVFQGHRSIVTSKMRAAFIKCE